MWSCIDCPRGGTCRKDSETGKNFTLDTKKFFWRAPYSFFKKSSDANLFQFHPCPFKSRCLGDRGDSLKENNGSNNSNSTCSEGTNTHFPLCAVCKSKWTKDGLGPCTPCGAGVVIQKWGFLLFFFVLVIVLILGCRKKFKKKFKRLRLLWLDLLRVAAIIVTFCQISSSVPNVVQIDWRKLSPLFASALESSLVGVF